MKRWFFLAFDHRNSFMTQFLGLKVPPSDRDRELARRAKILIFEALNAEINRFPLANAEPAVLVDALYGRDVVDRARAAHIKCSIPLERSGQDELTFETDPFYRHLEELEPDFAKVLIRYNPGGDRDLNARQRDKLLDVQQYCAREGIGLIVELLVPPTDSQLCSVADGFHGYDIRLRPALGVEAIGELVDSGVDPDLWKLEGVSNQAEFAALADRARRFSQRFCGCLLLGRGSDAEAVMEWIHAAAPVEGYVGFAVGRTLWWDPLAQWLRGALSCEDAKLAIGTNYRALVDRYIGAISIDREARLQRLTMEN